MWTRGELKERGKAALHRNYWIVVLATLVVTALTGGFSNTAGNGSLQDGSNAVAGNGDASATLMQMLFSLFGVTGDMIYKKINRTSIRRNVCIISIDPDNDSY